MSISYLNLAILETLTLFIRKLTIRVFMRDLFNFNLNRANKKEDGEVVRWIRYCFID